MINDRPARPQARREQRATRIAFFIAGVAMSAWAPLVPYAKARVGVSDAVLGLLLLCMGVGSILTMPVAGALAARVGCRLVIAFASLLLCLALPLLATIAALPLLIASILVFGAAIGALDVAMNIQAIIVERTSGRAMMSGFHGRYSLGGIVGAAAVTALLAGGTPPLAATLCVSAVIIVLLAMATPRLLPYGARREGPTFAVPHGLVLFIGLLCCVAFLAEGAVLDWSAVFLTSARDLTASYAGSGYATFATTMTVGRLTGDRIVQRFGGANTITGGGLCAALGFAITALAPSWQATLPGYALVGFGCSNIVPVLFTSAGRQTMTPEHVAVPAITTFGYAGVLAGPALIGFVAQFASLSIAFLILALMLLGVAAGGRLPSLPRGGEGLR